MTSQLIGYNISGKTIARECITPSYDGLVATEIVAGKLGVGEFLWCECGCRRIIDAGPLLFEEQHLAN